MLQAQPIEIIYLYLYIYICMHMHTVINIESKLLSPHLFDAGLRLKECKEMYIFVPNSFYTSLLPTTNALSL